MRGISFTKLSGAGNDFVLIDRKLNPEFNLSLEFIKKICDRRKGIGADGVLLISDLSSYAFDMKYFNADGSTGSLCANGARCALKYGFVSGRVAFDLVKFKANGKDYSGVVIDEKSIKFFLNEPEKVKLNFKIKAAGQLISASYMDTGSPHVVIKSKVILENPANNFSFYRSVNDLQVYEIGKEIRYSRDFAPEGANVNFIDIVDDGINIRTYERGVENETLACGTGSVAAALISFLNDNLKPPINLFVKSGDVLKVDFSYENQKFRDVSLTGPAEVVFTGELTI